MNAEYKQFNALTVKNKPVSSCYHTSNLFIAGMRQITLEHKSKMFLEESRARYQHNDSQVISPHFFITMQWNIIQDFTCEGTDVFMPQASTTSLVYVNHTKSMYQLLSSLHSQLHSHYNFSSVKTTDTLILCSKLLVAFGL